MKKHLILISLFSFQCISGAARRSIALPISAQEREIARRLNVLEEEMARLQDSLAKDRTKLSDEIDSMHYKLKEEMKKMHQWFMADFEKLSTDTHDEIQTIKAQLKNLTQAHRALVHHYNQTTDESKRREYSNNQTIISLIRCIESLSGKQTKASKEQFDKEITALKKHFKL